MKEMYEAPSMEVVTFNSDIHTEDWDPVEMGSNCMPLPCPGENQTPLTMVD